MRWNDIAWESDEDRKKEGKKKIVVVYDHEHLDSIFWCKWCMCRKFLARQLKPLYHIRLNLTLSLSLSLSLLLQDTELERPLKRYGSSQSQSSADTSPATSDCSLSPQFPASCSSLPLTSEDEKSTSLQKFSNKTYTISTGTSKYGESSTSNATAAVATSQRDSQTVYSSSSFKNVNNSKSRTAPVEVAPSPADSTATNDEASEVSDVDAITDFDRVVQCSPANEYMFSPLEARKLSDENVMLINKGEKTPHTLKKRPSNNICYKWVLNSEIYKQI